MIRYDSKLCTAYIIFILLTIYSFLDYFISNSVKNWGLLKGVPETSLFQVKGPGRRLINASSEICEKHPKILCLGRLLNHCSKDANIKQTDIVLYDESRVCCFRAIRDISPFEELKFDYEDPTARSFFSWKATCWQISPCAFSRVYFFLTLFCFLKLLVLFTFRIIIRYIWNRLSTRGSE